MDNLIVTIRTSQPEYVDIYNDVRTINDSAENPLSLTITMLEAGTKMTIANAKLEILGEGITRVSSVRCYNSVQNLVAGPHGVVATRPNFVTQTVHFTVVSVETTELVVQMVRI